MKHTSHLSILKDIGLSETEALTYEVLLEEGPASAAKIAASTGVGRGIAYAALTTLQEKGLIIERKGERTRYAAADPERLRKLADALRKRIEAAIPGLRSMYRRPR